MNRIILFSIVALLGIVGCANKTKTATAEIAIDGCYIKALESHLEHLDHGQQKRFLYVIEAPEPIVSWLSSRFQKVKFTASANAPSWGRKKVYVSVLSMKAEDDSNSCKVIIDQRSGTMGSVTWEYHLVRKSVEDWRLFGRRVISVG